jgi:hypothetical protein
MKTDLTITVEADVLRKARLRALQDDTSVNAFVRVCLEDYAAEGERTAQAVAEVKRLMDAAELHWGSRTWSREGLTSSEVADRRRARRDRQSVCRPPRGGGGLR